MNDAGPTGQPNPPAVPLPSSKLTPTKRWNRTVKLVCRESGEGTRLLDVALALSSFFSTGDSVFPGIPTIAGKARVCVRTAGEHLRKLERCGAISRKRKPKKHKTLGGSGQYRSWLIPPENWIWDRISAEFCLPVQSTREVADLCDGPSISDGAAPSIGKSELSIGNVADLRPFVNRQMRSSESANGALAESASGARKPGHDKKIRDPLQSRADAPGKYDTHSNWKHHTGRAVDVPGTTREVASSDERPASEASTRPLHGTVHDHGEGSHHREQPPDATKPWGEMTAAEQEVEQRRLEELRSREDGRYVPGGTFDIVAKAEVLPIGVASDALPLQCPECGGLESEYHGYGKHRLTCSEWQLRQQLSA